MLKVDELLPFTPDQNGHVPLYCAALWLATQGGTKTINPDDPVVWKEAFDQLLTTVIAREIAVFGVKTGPAHLPFQNPDSPGRIEIEAHRFVDCVVIYPYHEGDYDLSLGEDDFLMLKSFPYDDEDDWKGGFSDALVDRNDAGWTRLTLRRDDVLGKWPIAGPEQYRSGMPGQPTSKHLILEELEARARRGALAPGVGKEARQLGEWLIKEHPNAPQPYDRTIERIISKRYRELRPKK